MKNLKRYSVLLCLGFMAVSCSEEEDSNSNNSTVTAPATYTFERNGASSVSYSGQTDRLAMVGELSGALLDFDQDVEGLMEMYKNEDALGNDVDPFQNPTLNSSTKSVRSKTAASALYFSANTAQSAAIKSTFDSWIGGQVNFIFPYENQAAAAGQAGQIADGSAVRYVNSQGLEYDQMFIKGLIGALSVDQMLNNYLDPSVLDAGSNRADNDAQILIAEKNYTNMEHKWDEAYGYLFGGATEGSTPLATLGQDDVLLNKYLGRVINDPDFSDFATVLFNAFKLGRAAIVAKDYKLRDEQAAIIRETISALIGIRAVYYLQAGKNAFAANEFGTAFHDISEGYGFIYSLQFTHNPSTQEPYFSSSEVEAFLSDLMDDGSNGLWDVSATTLDNLSNTIASRFDFTVVQAAN